MSSFLDFSRLTPRERMLAGLRGQLSPTFGLEVGSPRAQLGVIPLAGLGRDGRFGALGASYADFGLTPPGSTTVLDPTTTTSLPILSPLSPLAPIATVQPTSSPLLTPLSQPKPSLAVIAPEEPESVQATSDDEEPGGGTPDVDRDGYDPGSYAAGEDVEGDPYQVKDYDSDGNKQDVSLPVAGRSSFRDRRLSPRHQSERTNR